MDIYYELIAPYLNGFWSWISGFSLQETVLLTGILIILGQWVSAYFNRRTQRKETAVAALGANQELRAGMDELRTWLDENRYPAEESADYARWQIAMQRCLDYYDYLCAGVLHNAFDDALVKRAERYRMITFHQYAQPYLEKLRTSPQPEGRRTDPDRIYRALDQIAKRWEQPWHRWP